MPYESGGRADKLGNKYEFNWIVLKFIDIIAEKIDAIKVEAIGEEEEGVDVWVRYSNGITEAQQCKGRNASKDYWTLSDLNSRGILKCWKLHLSRDLTTKVSLVSPLPFTNFSDLIYRAKTNDNAQSFIDYQVNTSSELKNLFDNYVKHLGFSKEKDIRKIINFLSRTVIRQEPYPENEEFIKDKVSQYFIGDAASIKSKFINLILQGEIYGRWLSFQDLEKFIKNEKIEFRNLARDDRIIPRINILNDEYKNSFKTLDSGLKIRTQFDECKKYIQEGKSIIIHGKAGNGKSGLTENIIDWCNKSNILHLDLKLDCYIPEGTAQGWGEKLGFPASISYCLNAFSKEDNAVLILDQLDALRWTARNSKSSLATCLELIREIRNLNSERENKISIIFVCRTYDLENDNGIKALFENKSKDDTESWHKVEVNELLENEVEEILGSKYHNYPNRLRQLLRTLSNLYVWEQINDNEEYYQIKSTYNLVDKWWRDLSEKCKEADLSEDDLNKLKEKLVNLFADTGKTVFSKRRIIGNEKALRYLISQGMLTERSNKVSFVHQSFLDCFVAERMILDYYTNADADVNDILGNKTQQNPTRRYQFQIFLQSLLEESEKDFLDFGTKLIKSDNVRFNFKYVFFEILGSIQEPSKKILNYIAELIQETEYRNHLCQTVISGHPAYVNFLIKNNALQKFLDSNKLLVINLLSSISPYYTTETTQFIKDSIENSNDKSEWGSCFNSNYNNDSEEFFNLRLHYWRDYAGDFKGNIVFYNDYRKNLNNYKIKIICLLLDKFQDSDNSNRFYSESKKFDEDSHNYIDKNCMQIVQILLPYLKKYSENNSIKYNLALKERDSLQIYYFHLLHEVNKYLISKDPKIFFETYNNYMGKGDYLYNEVILDALYYLPASDSDNCIKYLLIDFNQTLFEKSQGYEEKLILAKRLISKVSKRCSLKMYNKLEEQIIHYVSPEAKQRLARRIETNKSQNDVRVYWPFWGDLQYRLLSVLPKERMSNEAINLLKILERSNNFPDSFYGSHCGSVVSPLQGKNISAKSWRNILISPKGETKCRWDSERHIFIESSPRELARDFRNAVSKNPKEYVSLFLNLSSDHKINEHYIDGLLGGIVDLEKMPDPVLSDLEFILLNFVNENNWENLYYFFRVIEKHANMGWSDEVFGKLNYYLKKTDLDALDKFNENQTLENYLQQSYSTLRGHGIHALTKLIENSPTNISYFKDTILSLAKDKTDYVRMNSIVLLAAILDLDKQFAKELFELIFDKDERMLGHWHSNYILYRLYDDYKERIESFLKLGFTSTEQLIVKKASSLITEIYLNTGEMESIVHGGNGFQAESICEMAIDYLKGKNYKEKAKEIILHYLSYDNIDFGKILPQLFMDNLLDVEEDKELIFNLLTSKHKGKLYYYFLEFLEKQVSISNYEEIIFKTVASIISKDTKLESDPYYDRLIEEHLSKLMLNLYDEHKGDDTAEQCLDIIDQMFECEFGSSRMLINELMKK
ncbi:hypothetical protein RN88_05975 [Streptococcus intermedius]|uniref:hypothetical protein n=1 Tax=Streptococcus intermedius TaxID=1338 RepID=UPI0006CB1673|nr:hypothetical protein [Streptococcus intermedius]ALF28063.1 hypothetical protein RN88_05975 [Streptococcus intermedius]ARC26297.1 hypothetical protein A6J72_03080 [Streptococcus intermedius]